MSKVNKMLKRARAELLEIGNAEFEKKAHPLWELEAAGDKVIVNNKVAKDSEDKADDKDEGPDEVGVKLDVEEQLPMLPFEQGQMVMFILGGRSFTGSVLASDERTSIVQTGVRKYKVENDFLYKVSQMQTGMQSVPPTPPGILPQDQSIQPQQDPIGGMGILPNNLLNERVLDPAAPTPPGVQPSVAPVNDNQLQPPSLTNKVRI